MENEKKKMDLSIMEDFKKMYPDLDIKKPTVAVFNPKHEFCKLAVGDIVLFPIDSYKYTTIRSTPSGALMNETMIEGRRWRTKIDKANKSIAVIRIA